MYVELDQHQQRIRGHGQAMGQARPRGEAPSGKFRTTRPLLATILGGGAGGARGATPSIWILVSALKTTLVRRNGGLSPSSEAVSLSAAWQASPSSPSIERRV